MLKIRWEIFVGLCLALILQTSYRFEIGLGLGEIGLALFTGYAVLLYILYWPKLYKSEYYTLSWWLLIYLSFVLLPVTALYVIFENPGASFRDFFAYFLSFSFIFSLTIHHSNVKAIAYSVILFTLMLVVLQFFFGGDDAWYANRFTGGAKNPNQLGLYMVCCLLLTVIFVKKNLIKIATVTVLLFFGVATRSDAFTAYLAIMPIVLALAMFIPKKYFPVIVIPTIAIFWIVISFFSSELMPWLAQTWAQADEGGGRLTLYLNGLEAWLSSPATFLIGNGAGNFSGLTGPFQLSEAHNTPIDVLAMGGLLGFFLFYYFPIKYVITTYILNQKIVFSCAVGLICFSLFHFVVRHPIFWFTIFALSQFVWTQKKQDTQ